MLIGVDVVLATPAPPQPWPFGEIATTNAGSVAAGAVLAALTAARFAAPPPSVMAFGKTQMLLASLMSATFCVVPVESLTVNGLGQLACTAEPQPMAATIRRVRIQIFDFTVLRSCYLIVIGRATTLQPVLTEKSVCSAPHGVELPKTPFPE
jgi:hypothetical protein